MMSSAGIRNIFQIMAHCASLFPNFAQLTEQGFVIIRDFTKHHVI